MQPYSLYTPEMMVLLLILIIGIGINFYFASKLKTNKELWKFALEGARWCLGLGYP